MDPLDKTISIVGSISALALKLDLVPGAISNWRQRKSKIPAEHCLKIERATNGQVTRQDLRPKDAHEIWPDIEAPEKAVGLTPPIPEDCRAAYPLLKNCGRFKDERAIAYFLNLPPVVRTEIFNTTPPNQLISEAMCIKAKPTQKRAL